MQRRHILSIGVVASLGGCSDIFFGDGSSDAEPTENHEQDPSTESQTSNGVDLDVAQSDLQGIQLTTADLSSGYILAGEEIVSVEELDETENSELVESGLTVFHERAFEYDGGSTEEPDNIFSSVALYESSTAVENGQEELTQLVEQENGSINQISINNAEISFVGEYTTADDRHHGIAYSAVGEFEVYVITSDTERHFSTLARNLVGVVLDRIEN